MNKSTGAEGTVVVRAADGKSARWLVAMDTRVMAAGVTQGRASRVRGFTQS